LGREVPAHSLRGQGANYPQFDARKGTRLGMSPEIRLYITTWCPDCRRTKEFLKEHQISYEEIDIEAHPEAAEFVARVNGGKHRVPTFDVNGRTFHCSPFDAAKLARELGLS
jgi:glutaredoxin